MVVRRFAKVRETRGSVGLAPSGASLMVRSLVRLRETDNLVDSGSRVRREWWFEVSQGFGRLSERLGSLMIRSFAGL